MNRGAWVDAAVIEQQSPVFDGRFFIWFFSSQAVQELEAIQQSIQSMWGLDRRWCGAARAYTELTDQEFHLPDTKSRHNQTADRPACAQIFVGIDHLDTKSIHKDGNYFDRGYYLNCIPWNYTDGGARFGALEGMRLGINAARRKGLAVPAAPSIIVRKELGRFA